MDREIEGFKAVWRRFVVQTRWLQFLWEMMAAGAVLGKDSPELTEWLKKSCPVLEEQIEVPVDHEVNNDFGLQYIIIRLADGLERTAIDMAVEKVQGAFTHRNTFPKLAVSVGGKKRPYEDSGVGPSTQAAQCLTSFFDMVSTQAKRPRYLESSVPSFRFTDPVWVNPGEDKAAEELEAYHSEEDEAVVRAEAARDKQDGTWSPDEHA